MAVGAPIHWYEGLFLQPHHLQYTHRYLDQQMISERRLHCSYPYGIIELKISESDLVNGRIRIERLRAIMPSGLYIEVPGNTDVPVLNFDRQFRASREAFDVYLTIPNWYADRGNTIELDQSTDDDWKNRSIYRVHEVQEQVDENTGENPQPIRIRHINASLLTEGQDFSDMESLRLLRITRATEQRTETPVLDAHFIPPSLVINGSPVLANVVRGLANDVDAARRRMAQYLAKTKFKIAEIQTSQFEHMMRLKTYNRFSARLPFLADAPGVTPFQMYLELKELLGELLAMYPEVDPFEGNNEYDHENLGLAFEELNLRIREQLKAVGEELFYEVDFEWDASIKAMVAELGRQHLTGTEYFLAIDAGNDAPEKVAKLVVDRPKEFRMVPRKNFAKWRGIHGIKLEWEHNPPPVISRKGRIFFRLLRHHSGKGVDCWNDITAGKMAAIDCPGIDRTGWKCSLCLTLPAKDTD